MEQVNSSQRSILIVGGGTAGWMAANLFSKSLSHLGFDIALLESANIPTVGVGEGSTPYIRHLFSALDLTEDEWMPACSATYKGGITFADWSTKKGFNQYFHPFSSSLDQQSFDVFRQVTMLRHGNYQVDAHPNSYFLQSELVKQGRIPKSNDTSVVDSIYAYHFDATKLGLFLKSHAEQLGVRHIVDEVIDVKLSHSGDISSVLTTSGRTLTADIFVDCTGFKALLMEKTLGVKFCSFKDNLFNDSAVAIPTAKKEGYVPQTISTALSNGWKWDIPLSSRTGNGYVYSSDFLSADLAERELRQAINANDPNIEARHIKMKVGRLEKHWYKNCVAIGLSQGFIEPLEATALHIVQLSIEQFVEQVKRGDYTNKYQDFYNHGVNHLFEHIRDYIVLHYLTNSRSDTDYWKACRNDIKISDRLQAVMEVWCSGQDLEKELNRQQVTQYYSSMSWHVLLAGMGVFPQINSAELTEHQQAQQALNQITQYIAKHTKYFPMS
ncbi:tryptophan halogenase family protein [Paraglaciecola aquimarina]|uniref:Tryptophan halogenase family protein n=1 Tax=Paraglaciecola aquimarina TaxID=1235557 RepID=A0ABU3SWI3_9ALTE|nr:tryptophan halogenase family protein [Paraglaciecola aquimarina]MDU0354347.1 tryptophan halogenase family protein [Paraglaciecola aquimarina]